MFFTKMSLKKTKIAKFGKFFLNASETVKLLKTFEIDQKWGFFAENISAFFEKPWFFSKAVNLAYFI